MGRRISRRRTQNLAKNLDSCGGESKRLRGQKVTIDMIHEPNSIDRRQFIKGASASLVALPALSLVVFNLGACMTQTEAIAQTKKLPYAVGWGSMPCSSCIAPQNIASQIRIAAKDEPGEPFVMSGTIFRPDGVTPGPKELYFLFITPMRPGTTTKRTTYTIQDCAVG